MSDTNEEVVTTPEAGETGETETEETVPLSKAEYERLKGLESTVGSLKRDLKDLKKSKETQETTTPNLDADLLQKTYLRSASITEDDEVALALETSKKWGVSLDKLVDDEDFKVKLDKLRTTKANAAATAHVRGSGSAQNAKDTVDFWVAKGVPPTPEQIPDRKMRATIARALMDNAKDGSKFYNEVRK